MAVKLGTELGNTLVGTNQSDYLFGLAGNDSLSGLDGDDWLFGQAGDDTIEGGEGDNYLSGGDGNDNITAGSGVNLMFGGSGNDLLRIDFSFEDGNQLFGGKGNDDLIGSYGSDKLIGGEGNDYLFGSYGIDTIVGGKGDDTITGGVDAIARLTGGTGKDTFILGYSSYGEVYPYYRFKGNDDYALITDFKQSEDIIKLQKYSGDLGSEQFITLEYSLGAAPENSGAGAAIYIDNIGTKPELIAVLSGVELTSLSLDQPYFEFFA